MKNIRSIACIVIVLASLTIRSYGKPVNGDFTSIINSYIKSYVNNDAKLMKTILADDATLKLSRGESLLVQQKDILIEFMQSSGKMVQNCQANYEVLSRSGALVIARVDLDYTNATQHIYLILEKNADKEWKITQVCKMIDDKEFVPTSKDLTSNWPK
ncbi:MAG: nuclear transport factor 2 family protein [Mucilaginibacter sp.]